MREPLQPPATGSALPPVDHVLESWRLVAYAGATWDWHHLHHDADAARRLGLDRPVVDGQMFGALLADHIHRTWDVGAPVIQQLSVKYRSFVYAGETVTLSGQVTATESVAGGGTVVQVQQWARRGDVDIAHASARVLFAPRP
jgi:acyl dehydratase